MAYPLVAQLGPDIPISIVGINEEETWVQICCLSGSPAWVSANNVAIPNGVGEAAKVSNIQPPPTATPTATFTPTHTPTPTATATPYPFILCRGPERNPTENQFLTIRTRLSIGDGSGCNTGNSDNNINGDPAEGYYVKVLFEGFERPPTFGGEPSAKEFDIVFTSGGTNSNPREYNYKYEYYPPDPSKEGIDGLVALGTGTWSVYVTDGNGTRLSEIAEFYLQPRPIDGQPGSLREVFIHFQRTR